MTEKDAAQATAFANKVQNIENLDVKPMYNPFEAAEEQSMLDDAAQATAFGNKVQNINPTYNLFEKALAAATASKRSKP